MTKCLNVLLGTKTPGTSTVIVETIVDACQTFAYRMKIVRLETITLTTVYPYTEDSCIRKVAYSHSLKKIEPDSQVALQDP